MPRTPSPLAPNIAQGARRFADWRRHRTGRAIPIELWHLAAELGSRHGLSRTSRALHIQYNDLKKHLLATAPPAAAPVGPAAPSAPSFVDILIRSQGKSSETRGVVGGL